MTSTLDIITDAYRESNLIGIGVTPTPDEQTQGLNRLNAVVSSVYGYEVGEKLADWPVGSEFNYDGLKDWSAAMWTRPIANVRIVGNIAEAQTIYLPVDISDGARIGFVDVSGALSTYPITLNANGRLIENAADLVLNVDNFNAEWWYRADLANWQLREPLTLIGDMPFPPEYDDAFVTMLAMRLNPRYGRAMSGESGSWMQRSVERLKSRYHQRVVKPADIGVLIMSTQAYNPYQGDVARRGRFGWM